MQGAADYEKSIGKLVEREYVEKILFERARQFRDQLTTLSRRLAPSITVIQNPREVEDILSQEFRDILENFSKLPIVEE